MMGVTLGLDLFVLLLVVVALLDSTYYRGKGAFFKEYLSKQNCGALKGLMAVMIVFHHTAQCTRGGELFHSFHHFGYLLVAEFFFISGYGLMRRYAGSENYLKGYLHKRLSAVCIPYLCMVGLYWLLSPLYRTNGYTAGEVLRSFVSGKPIDPNSWYVLEALLLYILFYLLARVCKRRYLLIVAGSGVCCIGWIFLCKALGYGSHWYMSSAAFTIGLLWARGEERLRPAAVRFYWPLLAVITLGLVPTFYLTYHSGQWLLCGIVSSSLFVFWVLLLTMRVQLGSGILTWLGGISFELYMVHGLFLRLFRGDRIYMENEFLWIGAVLVCSIAAAVVLHKLFSTVLRAYWAKMA